MKRGKAETQQSNVQPVGKGYIPTLDGWRTVAIVAVLLSHALNRERFPFAPSLGHQGVLLFFAISGFLITNRLIDEHRLTGSISLHNFYVRRAFRILPPALLLLAVLSILGATSVLPVSFAGIAEATLFVRNYASTTDWYTSHFWSLSVEEHFYLFWPALFIWKRTRWLAPILAFATILWRLIDSRFNLVAHVFNSPYLADSYFRTDYLADALFWGCSLAIFLSIQSPKGTVAARLKGLRPGPVAATLAVILVGFVILWVTYFPPRIGGAALAHFLMTPLIGCTIMAPSSYFGLMLEWPAIRWLGRLSYSLYLWQQVFLSHPDHSYIWQQFPLNFILMFATASLSSYFVERPAITLGRKFTRKASYMVVY